LWKEEDGERRSGVLLRYDIKPDGKSKPRERRKSLLSSLPFKFYVEERESMHFEEIKSLASQV
jgi:hypothetical protein